MGAFSIKVVVAAMKVSETAREKGRKEGRWGPGPEKHRHLTEQTKGETEKNRKRQVREIVGQPREKGVLKQKEEVMSREKC